MLYFILTSSFLLSLCSNVKASLGNTFPTYRYCVEQCREAICDEGGVHYKSYVPVPFSSKLLWSCNDNCQYECMWDTVMVFQDKGWLPPQFHGKWPFIRWLGIQEPASTAFSLLNLGIHLKMFKQFLREVRRTNPMFKIWLIYAMCSINGWVWSSIFHTRDLPFTELMDYLSAFGMVLCTAYSIGMRLLLKFHQVYSLLFTAATVAYFVNHATYLSWGLFDYKYNMLANLVAGVILFVNCVTFSLIYWRTLPQSRSLLAAIGILVISLYLELSDFSPIWWTFDAHALWHLTTAPVTYYYWKFILEDSKYLQKEIPRW
ncbi:post-GPI attachment to proteins factor 3 [Halyomorpha halys]|uniref:post-GPI attachment to proteins factor 3 n=1 Tax=Halyomorpha halys TaxID=286706 RepID=UPI0006D4D5D8|nr:post-GPI attachment to proteins factor 3 [Halyomorpha halys]